VGHLIRCVALAEELVIRGCDVIFLSDLGGLDFAVRQLQTRGLRRVAAPSGPGGHLAAVRAERLDAVVLDSYVLAPAVSAALVDAGVPVLAVVDGPLRGQTAQLYLDQNIGAEGDDVALPDGARRLAGTSYALLRDDVRALRPAQPWRPHGGVPEVVVAFGGTDAFGVTELAVHALLAADLPLRATVVTPDDSLRRRVSALSSAVTATAPVDDFPRLLAGADLVVGAAGTSVWEYSCLGVPAAVAAVVDNQSTAYERLVEQRAVVGLGTLVELRRSGAGLTATLSATLRDETMRAEVASTAHRLVDGQGRGRVADELMRLVRRPPSPAPAPAPTAGAG
jgi:spore coat polysaccharide biosynthesis predicted glycosyltransferase SpsG